MTRFEAIKRSRKRSLGFRIRLNGFHLVSRASTDMKSAMKNRGRKLIKYLDVMNWVK
jgi:hypothetical protein